MNKTFYIKYEGSQPVEIETLYIGETPRRKELKIVSHLISAFKTAVAPALDTISLLRLSLHYPETGEAIKGNTLLDDIVPFTFTTAEPSPGSYEHPFILIYSLQSQGIHYSITQQ